MNSPKNPPSNVDDEASQTFVRRLHGQWSPEDQVALEARLESDRNYADSYARVEESWAALDRHAETPELMRHREEALAYARRANARRWLRSSLYARSSWHIAAAVTGITVLLGIAWQLSPYGYTPGQYRTGIGEQRMVELDDHSRIALDAATRLQVRYSNDARIVVLSQGQAQFSVAHDPGRPFKVIAGDRTIIAVGTVFTVEFADQQIHVAMMEGRVAVVARDSSAQVPLPPLVAKPISAGSQGTRSILQPSPSPANSSLSASLRPSERDGQGAGIELSAGEELRISQDGRTVVTPKADLEAATAWREGKVIFRSEQLGDAIRRVNRYSRVQIEIDDDTLSTHRISGVFEAGDTQGFINAIERYLPVTIEQSGSDRIKLRLK